MSDSRKRVPITGITTAESDKEWKRNVNQRLRRRVNMKIDDVVAAALDEEAEEVELPLVHEIETVYGSNKDGKKYHTDPEIQKKALRK